jgi:crotonobetainyl-CoA:carnitine CoA-transferase CaiB-like acyl-CoA transferase
MTAPLADVRVVELASFVAVPAAGALLADLGAEVIKVEVPHGEIMRHAHPRTSGYKSELKETPHFHMDNRGKRSLTLDIGQDAARAALLQVIDGADVVVTNMLPERLERYSLDAATLRARKPSLIFAALNGYGSAGEERNAPAFDYTAYWARTGFMDAMHEPDAPPAFLRPGVGDHAAALALTTGILAALRVRDQSESGGTGQEIGVNLMHMGFYVQGNDASPVMSTQQEVPRHDRKRPRNPLWNHYETGDGRWLFLVMIESERYWQTFCEAIERPDLIADERNEGPVGRYRNSETLTAALAETLAGRSLAEWEAVFSRHRIIWSPVRTLLEATHDPQAEAIGAFAEVAHPDGTLRTVAPPIRMSGHEMPGTSAAPALGADSADVLREAGLDDDAIESALSPKP